MTLEVLAAFSHTRGGLRTQFWEHFYRDLMCAKKFQTLISVVFKRVKVSNQVSRSVKDRGSDALNFSQS